MGSPPFQRRTRQREVILEELARVASHPTAVDLFEIVRRRLPKISLATVYRNLERLTAAGQIRRIDVAGEQSRFDAETAPHDHLRCVGCGRIEDLPPLPLVATPEKGHDFRGYEILGHRLEFLGRCPACRGRRTEHACGA